MKVHNKSVNQPFRTEGMTSHNIADTLCISISTVDTHRKNIMSKLDIHSVAGLVKYAIKHKIVAF